MSITKTTIAKAAIGTVLKDTKVQGLQIRIGATKKTWILYYRDPTGKQRRPQIGQYPTFDIDVARELATKMLASNVLGDDLSSRREQNRQEADISTVLANYRAGQLTNANSLKSHDHSAKLINARFGSSTLSQISHIDIEKLRDSLSETPAVAAAMLVTLSAAINHHRRGMLNPLTNPVTLVKRPKCNKRRRYLSKEEMVDLMNELDRYHATCPAFCDIIRVLILSGARKNEVVKLTWSELKGKRAEVDSKTGERNVYFSGDALEIINRQPRRTHTDDVWPIKNLNKTWDTLCVRLGLDDLNIHDLRHTFASFQLTYLGKTLGQLGQLLGHTNTQTTSRYAHLLEEEHVNAAEEMAALVRAIRADADAKARREQMHVVA